MGQRLQGQRVLITGTGSGQGAAAQALFTREGARVVGCDLRDGAAQASADELRADGFDATGMTVDISDPEQAAAWVHEAAARLGGVDVLYNNAAGFAFAPFAEMSLETWSHAIRSELDIMFYVTQPAWSFLCDGGGSVINTASLSGLRGVAKLGQVAHGAAKGGVIGFTTSLAAEGAEHGVRVNAISPGFVETPATAGLDASIREYQVSKHLIPRAGACEDVAYAALYLACSESAWVTGQNFSIDGGWSAGFR
jgi:NAD(P)-dependent dehydrogenase (short-subunit alcohol dehydrogenase family)